MPEEIVEEIRQPHKSIGVAGVVLLVLYIILTIGYPPFRALSIRFGELLTAIFKDFSLAYALIPIYMNWIASDYFQERRRTTLGNAATNGFAGFWVCIVWVREAYIKVGITDEALPFFAKLFMASIMFIYAFLIVHAAATGKRIAHIIGKVRSISYFAIMMTPIVFEVIPLNLLTVGTIIVFYPLFFGIIEFLEYYLLPTPGTETPPEEEE